MTSSLFTITPTPPTTLQLKAGQEGRFSFTVTSLAAPDSVHEVMFQALLVTGEGDKGKEVNWLVVGPPRTLSLSGGKTATVTITARPTAASPRGEQTIKLALGDTDHPNDAYAYSSPVICEVIGATPPPPARRLPSWLIPAIVGGALVLAAVVGLIVWKVTRPKPSPEPSPPPASGQAQLALDRTAIQFGTVLVHKDSAPATLTMTNTGTTASGSVRVSVTGPGYANATLNRCSDTLAPGASCQVSLRVTPSAPGPSVGEVTVTATPGGSVRAALSATALAPGSLSGIAWSGSRLLAVGSGGAVITSTNGEHWTGQSPPVTTTLVDVVWAGSQFIACGLGGTILASPDGAVWTAGKTGPSSEALQGVAWSGSIAVVTSASVATVYTSTNGTSWTPHSGIAPHALLDVVWGSNQFVAVGFQGTIVTSANGTNWTTRDSHSSVNLASVTWSGTQYVATGQGVIVTSGDGATWTPRTSPTTNQITDAAWSGSRFVGVVNTGEVVTSSDGASWSLQKSATGNRLNAVTWMGDKFVAVGDDGSIVISPEGIRWQNLNVGP